MVLRFGFLRFRFLRFVRLERRLLAPIVALVLVAAACGSQDEAQDEVSRDACTDPVQAATAIDRDVDVAGTTIRLATHGSFALSDDTLAAFTEQTGIEVEQVGAGDAGTLVSSAILTKDNPTADVLFGIDNAFLCRGLDADLFLAYESPELARVPDEFELDGGSRVTPISYGDVCANYWFNELPADPPTSLDDLVAEVNRGQFVTQDAEVSSPGFAFLLATIAKYGEDGWEDYWRKLLANDAAIAADWESAYRGDFIAGGGDRSIVMSYASSPAAEVLFADPPVDEPPTGVLFDGCFRQIEFAGILAGTDHPAAAAALIDFMLSTTYQNDIPLNMFVYPVVEDAMLPGVFVEHAALASDPLTLDPTTIEQNREDWLDQWAEIVLA
ncbi:MAG: thiamine ABC transporter substrate-binding protein [Acidimicrobiales bacterium]|nr:thiamine ABC transporter substrate-binding protein [Acidimicrobiales bacterium]